MTYIKSAEYIRARSIFLNLYSFLEYIFPQNLETKVKLKEEWDPKTRPLLSSHRCPLRSFDSCWLVPKCHFVPWFTKAWLLPYHQPLLTMSQLFKAWDQHGGKAQITSVCCFRNRVRHFWESPAYTGEFSFAGEMARGRVYLSLLLPNTHLVSLSHG